MQILLYSLKINEITEFGVDEIINESKFDSIFKEKVVSFYLDEVEIKRYNY